MKIGAEIDAYEIDGEEIPIGEERPTIVIENHHIFNELVVITVPGSKSYTVRANELEQAVQRCRGVR